MSCNINAAAGSGGPCGACKFLRRKCVAGCVFAPYFEADERGTAEFEAVHRVFGAKNAAKLLLRTPANKRLDAVVSLCYEALSRVRDPVYGCVAQLFNLQQQVENLQAQLAYVRSRVSMLKDTCFCQLPTDIELVTSKTTSNSSTVSVGLGPTSRETSSCFSSYDFEEADVEIFARELLSNYLPVPKIQPPSSP